MSDTGFIKKNVSKMALPAVIAVVAYFLLIIFGDTDLVIASIGAIHVSMYLLLLLLSLLSYFLRMMRWVIFMRHLSVEMSLSTHSIIYFSGYALTLTPGRIGETVRSVFLKKLGVCYPKTFAAFFSERFLDVLVVSSLSGLGILYFPEYQSGAVIFYMIVVVVYFLARTRLPQYFVRRSRIKAVSEHVCEFLAFIHRFLANDMMFRVFPITLLAWLCQALALYILLYSMGYAMNMVLVIGVYAFSILLGAMSSVPGGVGVSETSLALLLNLSGVDAANASAAAIINRVTTLWFAVVVGWIAMYLAIKRVPDNM